jgi:hypothetical protein
MSWWRRVVAAGAVLAGACSWPALAQAQYSGRVATADSMARHTLSADRLMHALGVTVCLNNQIASFVRLGLDSTTAAIVNAHEAKHREQAQRFAKDCERYLEWYSTPVGMLASEAEAYMADLCVAVAHGADPVELRRDYAQRIAGYLGSAANQLSIREAMAKYDSCPLDHTTNRSTHRSRATMLPGWEP